MNGASGYRAMSRLLDCEELTMDAINSCLAGKINPEDVNYLVMDESSFCKPYSCNPKDKDKAEKKKIDKVQNLDHKTVNGYHSNNVIALTNDKIQIYEHQIYSTKEEEYLSQNNIAMNTLTLINIVATVLLDRGYDNWEMLYFLLNQYDSMSRRFVVRASHLDRWVNYNNQLIQIKDVKFNQQKTLHLDKIKLRKGLYTDVDLQLSWANINLCDQKDGSKNIVHFNKTIGIIKADLYKDGESVFKESFYIYVPKDTQEDDVYQLYRSYFYRWKIEQVFKFIKSTLEADQFRVQDFKHVQKITALCFLVAAYYYEIGEVSLDDDFMIMINTIGENPDPTKPTIYYAKIGLTKLKNKLDVEEFYRTCLNTFNKYDLL